MDPHKATKWLGFWLAPDGNMKQQKEYMTEKIVNFVNKVRTGGKHLANDIWNVTATTIMCWLDTKETLVSTQCSLWMLVSTLE